jgi:DNA invertase Pin-like site-specific DNA recombinase
MVADMSWPPAGTLPRSWLVGPFIAVADGRSRRRRRKPEKCGKFECLLSHISCCKRKRRHGPRIRPCEHPRTGPHLTGQIAELQAAGCARIYSEKASGARGDRAELARVIKRLQPGDVLVVTRLDRLARSTRDLLNVLEAVKQAGAGFRSLKDGWCDTTTPHGVLMLTVLGGLAEFERTLIKARTGEGRERAKGRGVRFGRPLKLSPHQRREAIARLDAGDAVMDVARTSGVDRATLYRMRAEASG